ncbi:MAG: TrbI/VirB10 family protein [Verrucomicrobiales bacterium]|jgi:hypothetical protein|nr:TrbI/VirB10 family protein [Verrucomicrobiales bacterium]
MVDKLKWLYKTSGGHITILCALVGVVWLYCKVTGFTLTGKPRTDTAEAAPPSARVETRTEIDDFQPGAPRIVARPAAPSAPASVNADYGYQLLPIDGYTSVAKTVSNQFAPYGRLIKCKLVNTLESNNSDTPIVGLVMEDVWFNGQKLMSAGVTEIHGSINTSRVRDRINGNKNWITVWSTSAGDEQNGHELPLTGIALSYTPDPEALGEKWELIDGSAGLKGFTIDTTDMQKLLMVAAAFVQGAGQGLTQSTVFNTGGGSETTYDGSLKSGAAQGFSKAAELLAQSMLDEIRKNSAYVRVPAGTMFYVYVTQTLDVADARIGASMEKKGGGL